MVVDGVPPALPQPLAPSHPTENRRSPGASGGGGSVRGSVASDALKTGERQRVALTLRRRPTAQQLVTELVALTFVSGLVDAATYLSLGHIFAANQTGNIIVLGLALGGASQLSATASLASLASFVAGALFSGWAAGALEGGKNRWLSVMSALEAWLLGLATLTTAVPVLAAHTQLTVSILAVAMGMRTVTVQRLGIGGLARLC